jgi:hypothetical protein
LAAPFFPVMVALGWILTNGAIDEGLGLTVAFGTVIDGTCPVDTTTNVADGTAVPGATVGPAVLGTAVAGTTVGTAVRTTAVGGTTVGLAVAGTAVPGATVGATVAGTAVAGDGPSAVVGAAEGRVMTGAFVVGMKTVVAGSSRGGIVMTGWYTIVALGSVGTTLTTRVLVDEIGTVTWEKGSARAWLDEMEWTNARVEVTSTAPAAPKAKRGQTRLAGVSSDEV